MKKRILLVGLLALLLMLTGCSGSPNESKTSDTIPEILSQAEYVLSQNIFYNNYGDQYNGKTVTKRGILARIQDAYNNRTRYYVWGYLDNTKCCDWQWEFVPADSEESLPPVGSLVEVRGTFRASENALDDYWITDAQVKTETVYTGAQAEINMLAMSDTLERVQLANIVTHSSEFEGKEFFAYGRIAGVNQLEDPYYNGSWKVKFSSDAKLPAIGTIVILRGKVADGILADCVVETY